MGYAFGRQQARQFGACIRRFIHRRTEHPQTFFRCVHMNAVEAIAKSQRHWA